MRTEVEKAIAYTKSRWSGYNWALWNWETMQPYIKSDYYWSFRYERYKSRVTFTSDSMLCQACGGAGSWVEPILDDGSGPTEWCGFCQGLGLITKHDRGQWLRWKREEKRSNKS